MGGLRKKEEEEDVKMKVVRDRLAGLFLVHLHVVFMMCIAQF